MAKRNKMIKTKKRKQIGGETHYYNNNTKYNTKYNNSNIFNNKNNKIYGQLKFKNKNNNQKVKNLIDIITTTMETTGTVTKYISTEQFIIADKYKLIIKYNSNKNSLFVEFKKIKNKPYYPQQGGFFWRRSKKFPKPKPIPINKFDPSTYNKSKPNIEHSTINIDNDIKDLFDSIISFVGLDNNNYKCNKNKKQQCYIQRQTKPYKTKRYYKIYYYDDKKQIYEINIIIDKEQKYLRITTGKKGNWFLSKGRRTYKRSIKRN
jgi:hypothetical protein